MAWEGCRESQRLNYTDREHQTGRGTFRATPEKHQLQGREQTRRERQSDAEREREDKEGETVRRRERASGQ